ncbi:lipopolysaccharide biosynthesis protein [Streptomyces sp. NPDC091377]|uniref:lipopolysaccharide biosynthesis protein n=1 Tax=Streptomyces sp. NPDC091377 TaxID=3365995 RepID=UPI003811F26E
MADPSTSTATEPHPAGPRSGAAHPGGPGGSPLFRNAYALMLNTGVSAVLGLGFWLAAARFYEESAVGQGSAAIAAMKLLAGLTALTLTGALARFIPVAGHATGRLILRTYAGSSLLVAVAAGAFLLTLDLWGPSYRFLHGPLPALTFVVAVVGWNLLTLQDGVLTGLRGAPWVPVGNTVFSAVKLGLLVAFAAAVPVAGVFVSWVAAIATSVLPLGWLVFRRLVPRHVRATEGRAEPPTPREVGRFLAGDYTGSLFSLAVVHLVPVIVAARVGAADNAYFYVAVTIGGTVNLLAINMGASLTVEGSHDPARLAAHTRAALGRMARIMLPVAAVLFFGAPWILGVFGAGYAEAATPLLRWFAVGAVLRVVMETYFAVLRAQSRTAGLAWLQGLLCALVLGLTLLLLPRMGLTGAGVAEVSSLAVIVAIAAPRLYRTVRAAPAAPAAVPDAVAPDGDLADLGPRETAPADRPSRRRGPAWALDPDTLALGIPVDFDHMERRPDVRPGPGTPPTGGPPTGVPVAVAVPEPVPVPVSVPVPVFVPVVRTPPAWARRPEGGGTGAAPEGEASEGEAAEPERPTAAEPERRTAPEPAPVPAAPPLVLGALLVVALLLYWVPAVRLDEADLDRMGGLGLISVLPLPTLAGAALLVVVFAALLWRGREHRALLLVTLLATVVSLHALPAVIETEPRFATAWQHLGFLDHIERTGSAVPDLDARWSWPGFFAVAAFVAQAGGVGDFTEVIRWWPTAMQLLYLAPVFLLTRSLQASWRARWTGVWIFVLSGWVGQDYFSPQGFTYLLYLVFVALLLVWFRAPQVVRGRMRPGEAEGEPVDRRQRTVLLLVVIGLFAVSVPAHQLTPFVMLGVLTVLVLAGRSEPRGLPLLGTVMVTAWIGFLGEPYWSGHFDELFGGVGGVGGNVSSSVSGRIEGGDATHRLVLYTRVLLAGGVMALACWGWWRRRLHRYRERSLPILALVPFLGFGMQSYGGEMALRVFLFALPGAALLAALALFPRVGTATEERDRERDRDRDRMSLGPSAALLVGLVLMGGFLVARWGNEPFERVRPGEVAAMEYVYAHDDPTVRLLWLSDDTEENVTPALPWGARDMEKVSYVPTLAPTDPVLVSGLVKALKDAGPNSYLMVSRSQSTYLTMDAGYGADWERRLLRNLDERPELTTPFANGEVSIYALRDRPAGAVPEAEPGPVGPRVTWTRWSVVGGFAAVVLIVLLTVREVVRVATRPGPRQSGWLQGSFWFSLPLLAVFFASLVQRFLTMK